MKTFKARGIVLAEYEAGESDKRLVLLCKEIGRLTVYARGARKPKSKLLAAAQLFTYADFILADGRSSGGGAFNSVTQAEVIESFYSLRADYTRLCHAHLLLEVCDKAILPDTPCDDLLLLLLKSLSHLSKAAGNEAFPLPPKQILCVFMFRFFLHYGLAPSADSCCVCGGDAEITPDGAYFCDEGYVCSGCAGRKPQRLKLSAAAWAALKYITESPRNSEAFLWNARELVADELNNAARLCRRGHFEWELKSEEFI